MSNSDIPLIEQPDSPHKDISTQVESSSSDEEGIDDAILRSLLSSLNLEILNPPSLKPAPQITTVLENELTLKGVAKAIKEGSIKKIIVMSGAGISVPAGIPDFRSPKTGLYHNLQQYDLPSPEAIFEISFFKSNPEPFTKLARALFPGKYRPCKAHYFIRLLDQKGILLRNYTQNIDTLEREAGLDPSKIVEAHGSFATSKCITCQAEYSTESYKNEIFAEKIPRCECGGLIKPNIVFFGENLPDRFFECRNTDFHHADLLIVMGTSLQVQPFCGLICKVNKDCPRLLINREIVGTGGSSIFNLLRGITDGFMFDSPDNYRDVKWLGDIEEGIEEFVKELGWEEEFSELLKEREAYQIDQ